MAAGKKSPSRAGPRREQASDLSSLRGEAKVAASGTPIAGVYSTFARNNLARCLRRATFSHSPTRRPPKSGETVRAGGLTQAPKDGAPRRSNHSCRAQQADPGQPQPEMAGHRDRVCPGRHGRLDRPACLARAAHRVVARVTPTLAAALAALSAAAPTSSNSRADRGNAPRRQAGHLVSTVCRQNSSGATGALPIGAHAVAVLWEADSFSPISPASSTGAVRPVWVIVSIVPVSSPRRSVPA
jgi:hypothetical protein